jgi:ADP-ribose pyrophosphatase YjhB (NUDIX family)
MADMIDLYNRQRHPLDRTAEAGAPLPSGCYRIEVTGWIESAKGAFLMVRPKAGEGKWQAVSGGVLTGESSLTAVLREANTQLGIEIDPKTIRLLNSERQERGRLFYDVFLLRCDTKLDELTVNADLLAEARWMMPAEIAQMDRDGLLDTHMKYYADVVYPE